jgi:hypothetical protein
VQVADGSRSCFNCRHHWRIQQTSPNPALRQVSVEPLPQELFGSLERARLEMFRAAVRAGFYSDWPTGSAAREARI